MSPPSRRRFVRGCTAGVLAALGGCLDESGPPATPTTGTVRRTTSRPPTETAEATETTDRTTTTRNVDLGTTASVDGIPVTVRSATPQDTIINGRYPDAFGISSRDRRRYLTVTVESDPGGPPATAFVLRDEERTYPRASIPNSGGALPILGTPYDPPHGETAGFLAFELPAPLGDVRPRIVVEGTAWRLPDRVHRRLRRPEPSFELVAFGTPEAVEAGQSFPVTVRVRNASDWAATFRAVVVAADGGLPCCRSYPIVTEVDAGTRSATTVEVAARGGVSPAAGSGPVTVRLKTAEERLEASVPVEGETTESATADD